MLTPDEVVDVTRDLWKRHRDELPRHDRVHDYVEGKRGRPDVPEGAGDELEDIARLSVKNVLSLVRDAFSQSLAVTGFRSPKETENAAVWARWQAERLDARQAEPMRAAIEYGASYAVVTDSVRFRSPRQLIAVYADPHVDLWPVYALETWVDDSGKQAKRLGVLYDETHEYPIDLGNVSRVQYGQAERDDESYSRQATVTPEYDEDEASEHGNDGCPVVRFVNARDSERLVVGEIEPLIEQQRAINAVNFDRLVVSRFGAFPQRYAIGWAAQSAADIKRVSMAHLMAFDDEDVKVGAFPSASVTPYNEILDEMLRHVAMTAQIPPLALTGDIENIAAEAAAMIEAPYQRKLAAKRESFGESWEQVIRLMARRDRVDVDDAAEVVWRDSESRSFGTVVDGITKLVAANPDLLEVLVDDIPGWTQQQAEAARNVIRRSQGGGVVDALRQAATGQPDAPSQVQRDASDLKARFDALGVAIRAGVDPDDAARRLGLEGIQFTGATPVSLRQPLDEARGLEDK